MVIKFFIKSKKKKKSCCPKWTNEHLYRLNVAACVFHSLFAVMILCQGLAGKSTFTIVITTSLPIVPTPIPAPFNTTLCNDKQYKDVFKWFKCIRALTDNYDYSPDGIMPPFQTEVTTQFKMWTLIFTFCVITAVSHLLIATKLRSRYEQWLKDHRQPLRYLEYSITAPIMIVIVLALSRVTDLYLLIANALLMCAVNVFGGIIEWIPKTATAASAVAKADAVTGGIIRCWGWIVSAIIFVFQFWQLWSVFGKTISPWIDAENETSELMSQLFGFIIILNVLIFVCFLSFPIVNLVECLKKNSDFVKFEAAYIFCSFVAKGVLVIIVFTAAVQRN